MVSREMRERVVSDLMKHAVLLLFIVVGLHAHAEYGE